MSSIEAALAAIELLKPGEKLVYTDIAAKYVSGLEQGRREKGEEGCCIDEAT
jgi:hypothetical protein